ERLRVAPVTEERVGELLLRHHHFVLELLVARQAADELGDQRHVFELARPDAKGHFGRSLNRNTKRMAPCVSEKLAILLSTSPAARPAAVRAGSRRGAPGAFKRIIQPAPLGSIQCFATFKSSRSRVSFAARNT